MLCSEAKGKILLAVLFNIIILVLFALALEYTLRETHLFGAKKSWTVPDAKLGYAFIPGQRYWYKSENDHPITGRINSHGWRDRNRSEIKPKNTYRIAVLGDSFVEAFQVESSSTFLAIAEAQLNLKTGSSVEVMNFGRSGYTQTEEFLVLKKHIAKFSPNLVILFFFPGNDIDDISRETASDIRRPFFVHSKNGKLILDTSFSQTNEFKIRSIISSIRRHSALISLISDRYILYKTKKSQILKQIRQKSLSGTIHGYLSLCTSHPEDVFIENYKLVKLIIKDMAEYCEANGIHLMLVCCDLYLGAEHEQEYKRKDQTFNLNFFEDDLKKYSKSINIEFLGLQRIFDRAYKNSGQLGHWEKDGHWNYYGHRLVAKVLVERIEKLNLIVKKEN